MAKRLMQQVRDVIRYKHYSYRTEQSYCYWVKGYIRYHSYKHPAQMGSEEVIQFLTWLATDRGVSASTQNQAFSAVLFLYREVLQKPLENIDAARAKPSQKIPVVFTRNEVRKIIGHLSNPFLLMVQLLYGSGLRLMEVLRLRIKDIDLHSACLIVRNGKGRKDRVTVLPDTLVAPIRQQMAIVQHVFQRDKVNNCHEVWMPDALARKYPSEARSVHWYYLFPSEKTAIDPYSQKERRHHYSESALHKNVKNAIRQAGIQKHASCVTAHI